MRKLIIIAAAVLTPLAVWTAGCRQKNVAFPNGPEVKNLARAGGKDSRIPDIAVVPAAIDREVLAAPDQPTYARIRAVMDREARLASQYSSPGLFMLPDEGPHPSLAHAQLPEPAPYVPGTVQAPLQSQREFWSRPVVAQAANYPRPDIPADVSAMVPAAALPEPIVINPPPTAPVPVPIPIPIPIPAPEPELLLPPEPIPGVYMGEAPTPQYVPKRDYDALASSWLALQKPAAPEEPPSAPSPATFDSVAVKDLDAAMAKVPAAKSALPARLLAPDIRLALAPLPDLFAGLSGTGAEAAPIAPAAAADFMTELAAFMPGAETSPPDPASAPEEEISAPAPPPAEFAVQAESAATSAPAAERRDLYMMDFWDAKPPAIRAEAAPEVAADSVPEKVALVPLRPAVAHPPRRNAGIERIDAATDVPPLRF